ncbi:MULTISPECIES: helix-turn-helix domain-containing protein [Myroides]|uniref:Helix-turn-helix domain-containing protein n=1 Tax=Myroides albus TaxID=2562892 RepID=A0A6I3LPJ8_9FLAO|nr:MULTISPECIES: AraC family transcriptional regulator [Myroides]MTG98591.1 helix-turn-helix domain-containing protein [Myroides albus]MVX36623.1 helix-turn-helix domain-containing protein [Myroides sp. LoEW2-1]UVD79961.1 AraC family transcriptional regulator [Myroides albus]
MNIYIKNMVCTRCKMAVESLFTELKYTVINIDLGEVEIKESLSDTQLGEIKDRLEAIGFELLDDRKSKIVTKIKSLLIELVQKNNAYLETPLSNYISEQMNQDYHALSTLFSSLESTTIEQYFIILKIERVKELLVYDEISLKEIAYLLNYSSVAHLSKQFKKVTGLTPTHFKTTGDQRRKLIDKL